MREGANELKNAVSLTFKDILEYKIFSLDQHTLTVYEIVGAGLIVFLGIFTSKFVKRLIYKSERIDLGKKFAFSQMIHYIILVIIFFLSMKTLGVNISPLLLGSGAILVGIGLGLQNLFLDFISGIIILLDRTIQVGDIMEIEGMVGKVQEIRIRTTAVLTRDNKSVILPNSILVKDKLINFSHNDDTVQFEIEVGVSYKTDLNLAERLMIEAAIENEDVLKTPEPVVRLDKFGDSSLDLKLFYFSKNLFRQPKIRSDIRKSILNKFRENGVNIPFPIRTLEF